MPLADIPSMVQEEASRPQFTPTGSNTSRQEAMQCDDGILDKRGPFKKFGGIRGTMGAYVDLWGHMGTFEDLRGTMITYGELWGPMGACGDL